MNAVDKLKAAAEKVTGEVKEAVGKATDNDKLVAEGKVDKAKGEVKGTAADVKSTVADAKDRPHLVTRLRRASRPAAPSHYPT